MSGVLICPPTDRDAWLAARRDGIGASEIAAVLGISPWDSPFSLYWRKRQGWEIEVSDEMLVGILVEPAVAAWWERWADEQDGDGPYRHVRDAGLFAHPDRPWQLATPDRLVYRAVLGRPGVSRLEAVLECKWTGAWHGWGDEGTDDIPVYYRTQVQWQCDVMGVDEWHLAVLGPGGFRAYQGRRDEKDLAMMRSRGAAFWARVRSGQAPGVDEHSATLGALQRLHTLGDGELDLADVLDYADAVAFAEGYRRARALRSRADALVGRFDARIRVHLGDKHHRLVLGKKLIASRSVYEQSGDSAELAALEDDWPVVDRLNPGRSASYV